MQQTERESTPKLVTGLNQTSKLPAKSGGKPSAALTLKSAEPCTEIITPETKNVPDKQSMLVVSAETQPTDSTKQLTSLSADLDRSIVLINSTATDLHSCMKKMMEPVEVDPGVWGQGSEKVRTIALCAANINQLMRTQLKMVKQYEKIMESDFDEKTQSKPKRSKPQRN